MTRSFSYHFVRLTYVVLSLNQIHLSKTVNKHKVVEIDFSNFFLREISANLINLGL